MKLHPNLHETPHPNTGFKLPRTWLQEIFEGTLVNETRCLNCETVTSRDEAFLDLSLEIEVRPQNALQAVFFKWGSGTKLKLPGIKRLV